MILSKIWKKKKKENTFPDEFFSAIGEHQHIYIAEVIFWIFIPVWF